jgi:hypothetical protein
MPASQVFSGTGDPNGIVDGNPGDEYQDQTGALWVNVAAPSTWEKLQSGREAVVFDDAVAGADSNIRSDRAANQSPIDNTKSQITNLGSADGTISPIGATTGATGNAATISGGDDNAAVGDYSSVAGGAGNWTEGIASHAAGGQFNFAGGDYSHVEGFGTDTEAESSHAEGSNSFVDVGAVAAHAEGASQIGSGSARSHAESSGLIDTNATDCHAEGNGHVDDGATYSHAEGHNTRVGPNVEAGHAEGHNTTVLESFAHAEGEDNFIDVGSFWAHAEGVNHLVQGAASHAEGDSNVVTAAAAHAEGERNQVGGQRSHAEGWRTQTIGMASHAEGQNTIATGSSSHAQGILSNALREGQTSHASGSFQGFAIDEGNAQESVIVMREETVGFAPGDVVDLGYGVADPPTTKAIVLEDDKSYDFAVTAVIGGRQAGPVALTKTIKLSFNARRVAGVAVIAATGVGDSYGDPGTATWTLTPSAVGGDIVLTFDTGAGPASKCFVSARVLFTEVRFLPT